MFYLKEINLVVKMKKLIKLIIAVQLFIASSCYGQEAQSDCNQKTYGTKKYIKKLPPYICIPSNFVIDDYVRFSDLNQDGFEDFLAIKYNKKEDDQIDGDRTYWDFYHRNAKDTVYRKKYTLDNLVPPYLKGVSLEYLVNHPIAADIFENYPLRLNSHELSFNISNDTLRMSYKLQDTYGKTFVFIYDEARANWFLEQIEFFIGELPSYWWNENEFYYPLHNSLKIIDVIEPTIKVSIEEFKLKTAFEYSRDQWVYLAECYIDTIPEEDKLENKTIVDLVFKKCENEIDLPSDWEY